MDLIHITTESNPSTRLISKLVFSFRVTSHRPALKARPAIKDASQRLHHPPAQTARGRAADSGQYPDEGEQRRDGRVRIAKDDIDQACQGLCELFSGGQR